MSILAFGLSLLATTPAAGQRPPPQPAAACLAVDGGPNVVEGRLTRRTFAGPPNYQDVRRGDEAELTYILVLPRDICINDGGQFADPNELFHNVQVAGTSAATWRALHGAIGRMVRISGDPFAAHTGHHHAPLVILAHRVTPLAVRRH